MAQRSESDKRSTDERVPVLITEAEPSLIEQQRARVRKYTIMMSFRIPLFFLATWVYIEFHSGLAAMAILVVSIPLPWMAVLIANDRPPRRSQKVATIAHPAAEAAPSVEQQHVAEL